MEAAVLLHSRLAADKKYGKVFSPLLGLRHTVFDYRKLPK